MGKGIIADAAVEKYFADLNASTSYIIGLLVGQVRHLGLLYVRGRSLSF